MKKPAPPSPLAAEILQELARRADPAQAQVLRRYFKTGPGEYGAGDTFWGIRVPQVRAVMTRYPHLPLSVAAELLASPIHEVRLAALVALARDYERGSPAERTAIFDFYLAHTGRINNWDLVDLSAPNIVGSHLPPGKGRRVLGRLARSANLWERRIAMVATLAHIRQGNWANTLWLAETFLRDSEDLMHKASGWMLREVGKRDAAALREFLAAHAVQMPRTMLRYAIERFPPAERRHWLSHKGGRPEKAHRPRKT